MAKCNFVNCFESFMSSEKGFMEAVVPPSGSVQFSTGGSISAVRGCDWYQNKQSLL